ncbi:FadR/GntR family transcriptional regulator [Tropicimonas isoalkanivorans]|uniref:GntR family transcriptional regulator, transcriptional repressor for pyruvate dehydrogenase complex n=1 Tax=Tropicimonas isoalkanivorans TaxID=441112 RepID=A0A1I1NDL2_9RHOB|nr:FadR/GntR family transcriptional regulator [Tropicimonas isoalkanivorans]SFC91830.1 GntR family transcriptional regulator, transcriptional repressor for pyruvate dehydrogenase complex [Tropicimonas isoalkanivorans]
MKQDQTKKRTTLADRVYHMIYTRIVNGDYPPNQKLPSEAVLSEEFDVSRPVLRAALERLRQENMVYSRQGAGSFVRAHQAMPVGFARVETLADIQRCYEFRLTLETEAVALAAVRRNAAVLEEIEVALDLLRDATKSQQHREDADFTFHHGIAKASNNQYFETALRALREHINVGMTLHGTALITEGPVGLNAVLDEHTAIFDAIRLQQPEEARKLMHGHLVNSRDRLFGGGLMDLRMK